MKGLKTFFNTLSFNHHLLVILSLIIFIEGCLSPNSRNTRKRSSSSSSTSSSDTSSSAEEPTFSSSVNFFQNGTQSYSSNFPLPSNFIDSFYFRGEELHEFASGGNEEIPQCLVIEFDKVGTVLVLSAAPRSFIDFKTKQQEFYYNIEPANKTLNQSYCQSPGLLTKLSSTASDLSPVYSLTEVCSNCSITQLGSSNVEFMSQSGNIISSIETSYLSVKVSSDFFENTNPLTSCSNSEECQQKGYDCCSMGQCVTDGQMTDTASAYLALGSGEDYAEVLQALEDVAANPSQITNYPNFYHICAEVVPDDVTTEATEFDPESEEEQRFTELKELYECTTRLRGEMSYCTISYPSASEQASQEFYSGTDDQTFEDTWTGQGDFDETYIANGVVQVIHAGETLFENGEILVEDSLTLSSGNTSLTEGVKITLNHQPAASAPDDTLKIKYQIDGSCQPVNTKVAKCRKYYTQGQNSGYVDDHFPGSDKFELPPYADLSRSVRVEVDGARKYKSKDWDLTVGTENYIEIINPLLTIFDTQLVMIEYYVELDSYPVLTSKLQALDRIDELCNCGGPYCTLKPVIETVGEEEIIKDYACVYPQPITEEPPMQITFLVPAKAAPHRLFDKTGQEHLSVELGVYDYLGDQIEQEGNLFEYTNGNYLTPNNHSEHIGFNEIYGSMTIDVNSARPAVEVAIKDKLTYDIFVDTGSYSTCFFCGSDYYSQVAALFPSIYGDKGGGLRPNTSNTDPFLSSSIRKDELIFGRACWVPATMIPWTHKPQEDQQAQRLDRLAAQHFLYANGYQRDWYGFDYGAVIGSFDGVAWFAIGNQRQIKAEGNKLFIAINAPFSDLTSINNYQVTVSEASFVAGAGSLVNDDETNDGAECREHHICEKDSDCVTKLGWDYICEEITSIKTNWPSFDQEASEMPDSEASMASLRNLLQSSLPGGLKRCVYRGRGAPCHQGFTSSSGSTYNGVSVTNSGDEYKNTGTLTCAPNYHCANIEEGSYNPSFNNRISRYGRPISYVNASEDVSESNLDTFGLHIPILGRPFDYNPTEEIVDTGAASNLKRNNVDGLCLPGKNTGTTTTFEAVHDSTPEEDDNGDKVNAQGMTKSGSTSSSAYLTQCGIFDHEGNYVHKRYPKLTHNGEITGIETELGDTSSQPIRVWELAASQVTTTNMLEIFNESIYNDLELTKDYNSEQVESFSFEKNRCVRLPNSPCHTNLDCAVNSKITEFTNTIDTDLSAFNGESALNIFEIDFWKNELICSQANPVGHEDYDITKNRCCMESAKEFKIPQFYDIAANSHESYSLDHPKKSGSGVWPSESVNTNERDTTNALWKIEAIAYEGDEDKEVKQLIAPVSDQCKDENGAYDSELCTDYTAIRGSYNTIQEIGAKMCCTKNWIRNFHETNDGGHEWEVDKFQKIPASTFRCINWRVADPSADDAPSSDATDCSHVVDNPFSDSCTMKDISETEAEKYMAWFDRFELLGIPQVPIPGYDGVPDSESGYIYNKCIIDPDDVTSAASGENVIFPNTIIKTNIGGLGDGKAEAEIYIDDANLLFEGLGATDPSSTFLAFSAGDEENFKIDEGVKMIFSPDTITCCKPAGTIMEDDDPNDLCCTGFVSANGRRCALRDFTDVTLYLNLYVSSHLRNLPQESWRDSVNVDTGYIHDPEVVMNLACQENLCDSGKVMVGTAWGSKLLVPPFTEDIRTVSRFIEYEDENLGLSGFYNQGLKWNTHVYCIPNGTSVDQFTQNGIMARECP